MVRLSGFLPNFECCSNCGRDLAEGGGGYYSRGSESLFCRECKPANGLKVSAATLAMVRTSCHLPLEKWLTQEKAPPGCREARHFLEEMIECHTERKLVTRQMMEEEL
jgi:recombinational DNA repair protein (RecF pathway)